MTYKIHVINSGWIKKGQKPWNTGKKGLRTNTGRTHFKKGGHIGTDALSKWRLNGGESWNKGKKLGENPEHSKRMIGKLAREKNPNWKGGITTGRHLAMGQIEYKLWRKAVFERDNYTCQICFVKGIVLNADHIKPWALYPELRYAIDNGRTLCLFCHRKTKTWGSLKNYKDEQNISK